MSIFMTPSLAPITGGTYFPPEDDHGRHGFRSVLNMIAEHWARDRDGTVRQAEALMDALRRAVVPPPAGERDALCAQLSLLL